MPVSIEIANDLRRAGAADRDGMEPFVSLGADPGLRIRLPFVRRRFLVIRLEGADQPLDPQIYVDYGIGFTERNSVTLDAGMRHVVILDLGVVGAIRALRFDPATSPLEFAVGINNVGRRREAEALAQSFANVSEDTRFHRLFNLRGFPLTGRMFTPTLRSPSIAEHARTLYSAAEFEAGPVPDVNAAEPWLSLVVPVYDAPKRHLDDILKSYLKQAVSGAELILSDDGSRARETCAWLDNLAQRKPERHRSIRIVRNRDNRGIAAATNAGLDVASGRWIAFLDHDDLIAPFALKRIFGALRDHPDAQFLYTDELVVNDRLNPIGYMLKPAYDPVLLTGVNYINHFSIYRRERLDRLGRLREGYEGSQDYDLLLRYLDGLEERCILHLPYPAYWWRRTGRSYSRKHLDKATASARRALAEVLSTPDRSVGVGSAITDTLHRINFDSAGPRPRVSIVVPSKNAERHIERLLVDLFERTDYPDFEVVVIDNGSTEPAVLSLYDRFRSAYDNFSVHIRPETFNFARSVNRGFALAGDNHVLLLNNDVSVIHADWLSEMVGCLNFRGAGIVGAKLLYPDDTIQHAGVVAGFGGVAGHWYLRKPKDFGGPMNRLHVRSSMTCVTGAVMLISSQCRKAVGLFDEENFAVAYNDVDYCLRAHELGFRTIWTPFACLYHHESASRGAERGPEKRERFETEKANLRRLHGTSDFFDPAASPLHTRNVSTPKLLRSSKLPSARRWHALR